MEESDHHMYASKLIRRKGVLMVLTSASIVLGIALVVSLMSKTYIINQAEIRVRDVLLEAKSVHHYIQRNMHPAMYRLKEEGRMPEDFYSPEILSSSYMSRHIFEHFNEERSANGLPLIHYRLAAENPRNMINLADTFELQLLNDFNKDSTIRKFSGIIKEDGVKYMYYAQPFLRVEQRCLVCHGSRESAPKELREYYHWESGFDWELGIIPAVEIIRTPLVGEFKASTKVIVVIFFTMFVFFVLLMLNQRFRKQKEKINIEKQSLEKKYKNLFNNSSDPILILSLDGSIIEANDMAIQTFGYDKKSMLKYSISEMFKSEQSNDDSWLVQLLEEEKFLFETTILTKNSGIIYCEVNASLISLNNTRAVLCTIRDISKRKKQELELQDHRDHLELKIRERTRDLDRANKELQKKSDVNNRQRIEMEKTLNQLKDTQAQLLQTEKMASIGILTSGVAHEINNPLNYIHIAYEGLEEYFKDKTKGKDIDLYLESIQAGVNRASSIVKGLYQFSKTSDTNDEDCDIHSILDNCLLVLDHQMDSRITVHKLYSDLGARIEGSIGNLHQVFINIIGNAIEAIEGRGEIRLITEVEDNMVKIEIVDNGRGIEKKNLSKIVDPFYTTKNPGEGTGLGLSIVHNLVKQHGGELMINSEIGKGTNVIVIFRLGK